MATVEVRKQIEHMKREDVKAAFQSVGDGMLGGSLELIAKYVVHMERTRQAVRDELDRVRLLLEDSRARHARWAEEAFVQRELRTGLETALDNMTTTLEEVSKEGGERDER